MTVGNRDPGLAVLAALALMLGAPGVAPGQSEHELCNEQCTSEITECRDECDPDEDDCREECDEESESCREDCPEPELSDEAERVGDLDPAQEELPIRSEPVSIDS